MIKEKPGTVDSCVQIHDVDPRGAARAAGDPVDICRSRSPPRDRQDEPLAVRHGRFRRLRPSSRSPATVRSNRFAPVRR